MPHCTVLHPACACDMPVVVPERWVGTSYMIIIVYRDIYLLMVLLERLGLLAAGRVFPKIVSISKGVLERRRSTGSETFSL